LDLAVSIAGIVTQSKGLLCEASGFNVHFANVYLVAVDFASIRWVPDDLTCVLHTYGPLVYEISIALYGLVLFYALTKEELAGRRPLAKFLAIKLIVMFTFYQSFVVCFRFSRC